MECTQLATRKQMHPILRTIVKIMSIFAVFSWNVLTPFYVPGTECKTHCFIYFYI